MKELLKIESTKNISIMPKRKQLYYLYKIITNRLNFEYNLLHTFAYFGKCLHCRKKKSLKNVQTWKRDFYLNRGQEKLNKDLDIVQLLHLIHGYDALQSVLFKTNDRKLLHF